LRLNIGISVSQEILEGDVLIVVFLVLKKCKTKMFFTLVNINSIRKKVETIVVVNDFKNDYLSHHFFEIFQTHFEGLKGSNVIDQKIKCKLRVALKLFRLGSRFCGYRGYCLMLRCFHPPSCLH